MLVLVTDGFVDEAPLAGLRARLDRARIETIALAVGPDADVGALATTGRRRSRRGASRESGCRPAAGHAHRARASPRRGSSAGRSAWSSVRHCRSRREHGAIGRTSRLMPSPGPSRMHRMAVQSHRGDPLIAFQAIRQRPRGCGDQRARTLDSTVVAVARVAASRRWPGRLECRHGRGRRCCVGGIGCPWWAADRGRTAFRGR